MMHINKNNSGMSSVKILVIVAISLAVIALGLVGAIFIPKMFGDKDESSSEKSSKKHEKTEASSDIDSNNEDSGEKESLLRELFSDKGEEAATPAREPVIMTADGQYTELATVIQVMIENEIVTKDKNLLNDHDWKTVSNFFQICDRMSGISHLIMDKDSYDNEKCLGYYYFKKDTLEKLAYSVLGEKLEAGDLEEVADAFGDWARKKSEYAPNGYAYVEDDYLVLAVGEAGYMGPTADSFRKKYLGNGQWQIIANIVEEDYDNYYEDNVMPFNWNGVIAVTVEEDPDSYFDGFKIVDASWHDAKDPEYSTDWQRAYFEIIQKAYKGELGFGTQVEKAFDFIYFNDDDIPDLVVNSVGYNVAVYCFDGKEAKKVFNGGYGAFGLSSYNYIERESIVVWCDADFAGLEVYTEAFKFLGVDDCISLYEETPCVKYYKDKNKNGTVDEGEDDYDHPYYYIGDKEVTEQEFNEYEGAVPETTGDLVEANMNYWAIMSRLFRDDPMQEQ